ncbi:alpha/beta hydrolase fold domain-containing protein [Massilia forsythiae]|uniref:Alpha/beta hydrolase fold domain-containing protein n=1 Tax=Massilia forsythiae TaxID=2728020 RepID=A0A7Z2ZR74_9BURK|nr:alpha/beta hydrolase [Massilia forsythiae]QJD99172.1 alpha/beta hydrolase fold domain-containing protein [Massilia forsythiae]
MNTRQKMAAGMAGVASMLWLGLTAAVTANQRRLVFNPTLRREVARPRSQGHRTRPVVLRAADGTRLSGWLMTPHLPGRHPAVLYFGGRSEEVSWVVRDAARLFPGMAVLAMNYRGYGASHGVPAEIHMVDDGRMLFDWLAASDHVDPQRIAVVGRSLGSGVAVQVAKARPAHAVVLVTPYDSILAIAKRRFRGMPIGYMLRHRFESIKYAPSLTAPTYVLRAASDDVVPHSHTDQLVARLARLCGDEVVPGSNHMNIPYLAATQERIAAFLTDRFRRPAPAAGMPAIGAPAAGTPAAGTPAAAAPATTITPAAGAGSVASAIVRSGAGALLPGNDAAAVSPSNSPPALPFRPAPSVAIE